MTAWLGEVKRYWSEAQPRQDHSEMRARLVDLYLLAKRAPPEVLRRFTAVRSDQLRQAAAAIKEKILENDHRPRVGLGAKEDEVLIDIGAELRALDQFLHEYPDHNGTPVEPHKSWKAVGKLGSAYVIPCRPSPSSHEKTFGAFDHRALIHHRLLPTEVLNYPVQLNIRERANHRPHAFTFGSVLFSEVSFQTEIVEKGFLVSKVDATNQTKVIDDSVVRAHREKCEVLCFPELTISPAHRERIRTQLIAKPWKKRGEESHYMSWVVAGSWHVSDGDKVYNVAQVFDGFGDLLMSHMKLFPYFDRGDGSVEGIEPGKVINVLVDDGYLIAVGICLDFCSRDFPNVFSDLNVDLVLVVSCGNDPTMGGHLDTARDRENRFHAQSFVIQQRYPIGEGFVGYVLSPYDPLNAGIEVFKRNDTWIRSAPAPTPMKGKMK